MRPLPNRSEGSTVVQRLFLLVLLPLTGLIGTLGIVATDRWTEREAGAAVVARVDDLRTLVNLQLAVYNERAAVEIQIRSDGFGVPSTLGAGLLGIPGPNATFAPTDAAITLAVQRPPGLEEMLTEARALGESGNFNALEVYEQVDKRIVATIVVELETMRRISVDTADEELIVVLEQLEAAVLASSASTDQTAGLADAWFGPDETRARSLAALGSQTARFELALASLDPASVPDGLLQGTNERTDAISSAVLQVLQGGFEAPEAGDISDLPLIIGVFESSFLRNAAVYSLVEDNAVAVQRTAGRIADDASDSFVAALTLGAAMVLASILASWRLAGSIAVPMASVATRTRELQAGQIEASPLSMAGPRELRDVASAINDVSVNLDSLEGKLAALARADLDDERLSTPVPGRLGETLTRSVDTLSASIADRRSLQARLVHQANHDALTGLSNRAAVLEQLSARLENASWSPVGLFFVDLDDFKRANDVYGHATGDQVLVEVGRRLTETCRPTDVVARLGGDEFLIVTDEAPSLEILEKFARRIVEVVTEPMPLRGTGGLVVAASVGVARCADSQASALDFLSNADAALYRAKAADSRIATFDDDLRVRMGRRSTIEQRLHSALAANELDVHYQPVVHSGSLRVGQVEALVRWTTQSDFGPDDFIPVAEQSDLVVDIDRFVLNTATSNLAVMTAAGAPADLSVAVNISGRHLLHADIVAHVAFALEASGLNPRRLIIEVTETALIADLDRAAAHLSGLRAIGVRISVDDFGTGFTSISQLRRLPVDELKIDRSLISELPNEQALVRVVRDLAEHFGMTTVAEGVETEEQAEFLRQLGCDRLQGWLYARAMTAPDLDRWLAAHRENTTVDRVGSSDMH